MTIPFQVGDTVLAFTDGLIERRDEDITAARSGCSTRCGAGATDLSAALEEVVTLLRDPSRDDDVAALAARRTG